MANPNSSYKISGMDGRGFWNVSESKNNFISRAHHRFSSQINVQLTVVDSNGVEGEIDKGAVTKNISEEGCALLTKLEAGVGDRVKFTSEDHEFSSMAVVCNRRNEHWERPVLHLNFIDSKFPTKDLSSKLTRPKTQSGFSLIEAMITMVIFLMVMAAIFGVLRAGNVMRDNVSDRSEIVANARVALNFIGKEAVNAGLGYSRTGGVVPDDFINDLVGIPKDPDSDRDIFPGVIAGNDVAASDLSVNGEKNDIVVFVSRDLNFNNGETVVIKDYGGTASVPALITDPNGCPDCRPYDVYLVEGSNGNQALAMATGVTSDSIQIDDNDPLKLNRDAFYQPSAWSILIKCSALVTTNCTEYYPQATAKRIFITSFSVLVDGTLVRTVYGNNTGSPAADQIQVQPLAFGVQNFQIRYLMQDGTIVDDPSEGNTNQMKLNEVVQVEISVTIKSETNTNGVTSTQLINMDSTYSTRNLRYDFD